MAYHQPSAPMVARPAVITSNLSDVNPTLLRAHLQRDMSRFIHSSRGTHAIPASVTGALALSVTASHATNQQAILATLTSHSNHSSNTVVGGASSAPPVIGNVTGTINNPHANFYTSQVLAVTTGTSSGSSGSGTVGGTSSSSANAAVFALPGKATASATASVSTYMPAHDILSNHALFNYKLTFASVQQEALFRRVYQFLATSNEGGFEHQQNKNEEEVGSHTTNKPNISPQEADSDATNVFVRRMPSGKSLATSPSGSFNSVGQKHNNLPTAGKVILRQSESIIGNTKAGLLDHQFASAMPSTSLPSGAPPNNNEIDEKPTANASFTNNSFVLSTAAAAKKETMALLAEASDRLLSYIIVTTPAFAATIDNGHGGFGIGANGYPHVGISNDLVPTTVPSTAQLLSTITASPPIMRLCRSYPQLATLLADKVLWGFYHQLLRDAVTNTKALAAVAGTNKGGSPTAPLSSGSNVPSTYSNRVSNNNNNPTASAGATSATNRPMVSSPILLNRYDSYSKPSGVSLSAGPTPGTSVALLPAPAWLSLWLDLRHTLGNLGIAGGEASKALTQSAGPPPVRTLSSAAAEWLPMHINRTAVRDYDAITGTLSYPSPTSAVALGGNDADRDVLTTPLMAPHIPMAPFGTADHPSDPLQTHFAHIYRSLVPQIQLLGAASTLPSPLSGASLAAALIACGAGNLFMQDVLQWDTNKAVDSNISGAVTKAHRTDSEKLSVFFGHLFEENKDAIGKLHSPAKADSNGALADYLYFTSVVSPLLAHRKGDFCRGHAALKPLVTMARVEKDVMWRQLAQVTDALFGDVAAIMRGTDAEGDGIKSEEAESNTTSGPPSSIGHGRGLVSVRSASTLLSDNSTANNTEGPTADAPMLPASLGYLIDAPTALLSKLRQKATDLTEKQKTSQSVNNKVGDVVGADSAPASPTSKHLGSYQYQYHPPKSPLTPHSASSSSANIASGKAVTAEPPADLNTLSAVPMRFHEQFHPDTTMLVCLWGLEELINVNVLQSATYDPRLVVAAPQAPAAKKTEASTIAPATASPSSTNVPKVVIIPATPVYTDPVPTTKEGDEASPNASPSPARGLHANRGAEPSIAPNSALASMAASPERVHVKEKQTLAPPVDDALVTEDGEPAEDIKDADQADAGAMGNEDQPLDADLNPDQPLINDAEVAIANEDLGADEPEDANDAPARETLDSLTAVPYEDAANGSHADDPSSALLSPTVDGDSVGAKEAEVMSPLLTSPALNDEKPFSPTTTVAAVINTDKTSPTPKANQLHLLMPPVSSSLLFPSKTPASVNSLYANIIMSVVLLCSSRTRPYVLLDGPRYSKRIHSEAQASIGSPSSQPASMAIYHALRCLSTSVAQLNALSSAHNAANGSIIVGATKGDNSKASGALAFVEMGTTAHHHASTKQPEPHNPLRDTSTLLTLRDLMATAAPPLMSTRKMPLPNASSTGASSPTSAIPSYLQVTESPDYPSLYSIVPTPRAIPATSPTLPLSFATIQTLLQWQFQAFVQHPTPVTAASILHVLVREGEAVMNVMINATPLINSPDPFNPFSTINPANRRPTGYGNSAYSGGQQGAGALPSAPTPSSQLIPIGDGLIMWVARTLQIAMASHGSGAFDSDISYTPSFAFGRSEGDAIETSSSFYAPKSSWPLYCQLLLAAVRLVNARNAYIRHPWWNGVLKASGSGGSGKSTSGAGSGANYVGSIPGPAGMHRDAQKALGLLFLSITRLYLSDSDSNVEKSAKSILSYAAQQDGSPTFSSLLAQIERATSGSGPTVASPLFPSTSDEANVFEGLGADVEDQNDSTAFMQDENFRPFDNATFFAPPTESELSDKDRPAQQQKDSCKTKEFGKNNKSQHDSPHMSYQTATLLLQKLRHRTPIASCLRLLLRCVEEALRDGANPQLSETISTTDADEAALVSATENKLPSYLDDTAVDSTPYRFTAVTEADNGSSANLYGSMRVSGITDPEPRRKGFGQASLPFGVINPLLTGGSADGLAPTTPSPSECPEVLRQTLVAAARMGPMIVNNQTQANDATPANPSSTAANTSARIVDPSLSASAAPFAEMNLFHLIQNKDGSLCVNGDLIETLVAAVRCTVSAGQNEVANEASQPKSKMSRPPQKQPHIPTYQSPSKNSTPPAEPEAPSENENVAAPNSGTLSIALAMDGGGKVTKVSALEDGSASPNPQRPPLGGDSERRRESNGIMFNPALVNVRKTNLNTVLAGVPTLGPCLQNKLPASGEYAPLFDVRDEPGSYELWPANGSIGDLSQFEGEAVDRYFDHLLSTKGNDSGADETNRPSPLLGASSMAALIAAHKTLSTSTKGLPPHCNPRLLQRYLNDPTGTTSTPRLKHRVLTPGYGVPPSHTAWAVLHALDALKGQWPILHLGTRKPIGTSSGNGELKHYGQLITHL